MEYTGLDEEKRSKRYRCNWQEVEKVLPHIVREKDVPLWKEKDEEIKGKYKTVDYEKLTALLIEVWKNNRNKSMSWKKK